MRFSVLKAGTALPKTKERLGDYGTLFTDVLSEPGQAWDVHDVEHGEFPEDPSSYDGFVITGSRASVYEQREWIRSLEGLIRKIHRLQVPLIGVCFGHQAVARALGGEVCPNESGWNIGVREVSLAQDAWATPLLRKAPRPLRIMKSHQDEVVKLPSGAVPLATSETVRYEMFSIGSHILCLQGHPEFDHEAIQEIIAELERRGVLEPHKAKEAAGSLSLRPHRAFWVRVLRTFLSARR